MQVYCSNFYDHSSRSGKLHGFGSNTALLCECHDDITGETCHFLSTRDDRGSPVCSDADAIQKDESSNDESRSCHLRADFEMSEGNKNLKSCYLYWDPHEVGIPGLGVWPLRYYTFGQHILWFGPSLRENEKRMPNGVGQNYIFYLILNVLSDAGSIEVIPDPSQTYNGTENEIG